MVFSTCENVGEIFETLKQRLHRNCRARQIGHVGLLFRSDAWELTKFMKNKLYLNDREMIYISTYLTNSGNSLIQQGIFSEIYTTFI